MGHRNTGAVVGAGSQWALDPSAALERSRCERVQYLVRRARETAAAGVPTLIVGDPGTGKSLLARAMHQWSGRHARPCVELACAGRDPQQVATAVVSAASAPAADRLGLAGGGTLLLLRVDLLELHGSELVAETLQSLPRQVVVLATALAEHRVPPPVANCVAVQQLRLPALRERLEDIPGIAECHGVPVGELRYIHGREWPGNIRELVDQLRAPPQQAVQVQPALAVGSLSRSPASAAWTSAPQLRPLVEVEREHIGLVLRSTGGKLYGSEGAARILGLKPTTLQSRMRRLGLTRTG